MAGSHCHVDHGGRKRNLGRDFGNSYQRNSELGTPVAPPRVELPLLGQEGRVRRPCKHAGYFFGGPEEGRGFTPGWGDPELAARVVPPRVDGHVHNFWGGERRGWEIELGWRVAGLKREEAQGARSVVSPGIEAVVCSLEEASLREARVAVVEVQLTVHDRAPCLV
jgi:hypothetical protein